MLNVKYIATGLALAIVLSLGITGHARNMGPVIHGPKFGVDAGAAAAAAACGTCILLENGDNVLLENGDNLLLE